jgi:hypothetical protein
MKGHIHRNDAFHQWLSSGEVDHRTKYSRGREVTPHHDLMGAKGPTPNTYARAPAGTGGVGDGHFDRVAGCDVQTM